MNTPMKILIAYDGSACADAAVLDLGRAGLPGDAEALVVTVTEIPYMEAESNEKGIDIAAMRTMAIGNDARRKLEEAVAMARTITDRLATMFPGWHMESRVYAGSPAWGVLRAADEWNPDLIVVGSHGRTALGRMMLGSVSQKVLTEARSSVRIARGSDGIDGAPVRILVGLDGTPDSDAAIDCIAARQWPERSCVRVVAVTELAMLPLPFTFNPDVAESVIDTFEQEGSRVQGIADEAAEKLRAAGLLASSEVHEGAPVAVLLEEARRWGADCITLGARGHRFMERFLLGSVSAAVAARSDCSVEIVRLPNNPE